MAVLVGMAVAAVDLDIIQLNQEQPNRLEVRSGRDVESRPCRSRACFGDRKSLNFTTIEQ
jgi:hypothetical protein